ncbi:hypothetical protein RHOSPDRAFT_33194 [Rhodotorula sp. JG-1b]|nr:hypothetical protein RHOSPDRAFT_33194 [Rhodotorula sp. JG-1b]
MGRAQRHFAITHSPVVRSFIKPVKSSIVVASSSSTTVPNPYLPDSVTSLSTTATLGYEQEQQPAELADVTFLIPTQPVVDEGAAEVIKVPTAGSSDVKGKKRARDEDEVVAEYEEAAGTRFGVVVRYTEDNLPEELEKYWAQRYRLFSRFDEGCEMDREGWYSVTPENIAMQIAERLIALDTSPVRLACAAHNAALYGVADRITFILADWVTWTESYLARMEKGQVPEEEQVEVVFLSPPWGGIEYQTVGDKDNNNDTAALPPPKKRARVDVADCEEGGAGGGASKLPVATTKGGGYYPLAALAPLHGRDLFHLARRITPHVAYYLPRNVDLLELATLVDGERIEIEEEWMSGKLKAVTAYFGDLVAPEE